MHLLIVDEKNPHRVLRLTVTTGARDVGHAALARGDIDVEELHGDELYQLLLEPPAERTIIVRTSALAVRKPDATKLSWMSGL